MFYRLWRVPATGFGFALMGIGGVFISVVHTLIVLPLPFKRQRKNRVARTSIRHAFYCYVRVLKCLGLLDFQIHNRDRLDGGGQLIIANHPSLLDVVFLMSIVPNANCVVKAGLWRNPFTTGPVRVAGYIRNDDKALLERCVASLAAGDNLIIFPEGTRTIPGEALKFQRGLAYLALSGQTHLSPVVIDCSPPTLLKGMPWYIIPPLKPIFRFWVDGPLAVADGYDPESPRPRQVRQLCRYLQNYFEIRLKDERAKYA